MDKKNNFFDKVFSIDEARFSILSLCLVIALGFGIHQSYILNDIPDNITNLIVTFSYIIGGVNGVSLATKAIEKIKGKKESKVDEHVIDSNDHGQRL